ncbi:MAG: ATP-binding protein [Oscillospiraceae bacterium]|nr:ATP-binding protein [Oscillospiraceae bacterium]
MKPSTLHLMVGLPCSGKTTYARQLAQETNALLLTRDTWHLKLFGDDVGDEQHHERHNLLEALLWDIAEHVLKIGGDVILDFGCWKRAERDAYKARANELGVNFKLHYMDVPVAELHRRLELRNRNPDNDTFFIPTTELDKVIAKFQPPAEDELN